MLLMNFISHICAGIILSFIGSLPFGLINITASKISIEKGIKAAMWFALGASFVEIIQAYLSITFASLLIKQQAISQFFQWFSICLFLGLSIYYLFFSKSEKTVQKGEHVMTGRLLLSGVMISALNFMVFPYWIFYYSYLKGQELLSFVFPYTIIFSLGVGLGTFLLLFLYGSFGKKLISKYAVASKYINKIIGMIFLILASITFFQL
jgi:threonine/homoserine/homoserine lactone efflux protein